MPAKPQTTTLRRAAAFAAVLILGVAILVAVSDSAAKSRKSVVLGATKETPKPLCPKDCRGTGSVTGFGVIAQGKKGLYRIPQDGHIVAWSVDLSKPDKDQIAGFGEIFEDKKFGTDPVGRLAILKKKKNKDGKPKSRYALAKQSPTIAFLPDLGHKPIITLDKPLKVKRGQVAALTLPTWAPLYTDTVSNGTNAWKASRPEGECGSDTVPDAKPHLRKGTTRTYGCTLTGERILYWAYFVPSKGGKGGGGNGGGGGGGGGGGKTDPNRMLSPLEAAGGIAPE